MSPYLPAGRRLSFFARADGAGLATRLGETLLLLGLRTGMAMGRELYQPRECAVNCHGAPRVHQLLRRA